MLLWRGREPPVRCGGLARNARLNAITSAHMWETERFPARVRASASRVDLTGRNMRIEAALPLALALIGENAS